MKTAPKHRLDWNGSNWLVTIETHAGTVQLTLDEFKAMHDAIMDGLHFDPQDEAESPPPQRLQG